MNDNVFLYTYKTFQMDDRKIEDYKSPEVLIFPACPDEVCALVEVKTKFMNKIHDSGELTFIAEKVVIAKYKVEFKN